MQRIEVPGMGIVEFPDGMSDDQIAAAIRANMPQQPEPRGIGGALGDFAAGAVRGAGSIGATILTPIDAAARKLGLQNDFIGRTDRREAMDEALRGFGADTGSLAFAGGKLGSEIAGTAGAGGLLARGAAAIPGVASRAAPALEALRTAGFSAGGVTGAAGMGARVAGGAAAGGAAAGLVNPEDAGIGAGIGAALPPALRTAGMAGRGIGNAVRGGGVAPEVAALAQRAKDLGINIPADRLVNSKPLDAIASGLNYVPFSGRAATEARMAEQLNQAASRLMGQNTPNINLALRKAGQALGSKFDDTLRSNGVAFDQQLLRDVSDVYNVAQRELGSDSLKAISSQVDELVSKGASGTIDGQAAYNIKRTLDRIGRRNTPEAWHALELKGRLMEALNRSLGPQQAAEFATTRQQYGNMLALEKLAKNGVEGEISVARLANLKNINNQPLQELADIAAQFVKPRESQHGAMQRAVVGLGAGLTGGPVGVASVAGGGRVANTALNADWMRNLMLSQPSSTPGLLAGPVQQGLLRSGPLLGGDR